MIIIEGADNCGKSTLVEQMLALDPSLRLLHRDRFRPSMHETIATSYINALMPPGDGSRWAHGRSVADRFFASECIYGQLYRGGCRMTANDHFMIKALLISYGAFVVHCDPPDDAIIASWKEREQLYDKDPLEIVRAYRDRIKKIFYPIKVLRYNWTDPFAERYRLEYNAMHARRMIHYEDQLKWPVATCTGETQ